MGGVNRAFLPAFTWYICKGSAALAGCSYVCVRSCKRKKAYGCMRINTWVHS